MVDDHRQFGRAGLAVPTFELTEVAAVGVGHASDEIIGRNRRPVMAREIQVHALAEAIFAEQRGDHADHLGAFAVNGGV